ncbi:MAG TPA: SRPBCC domain-containing protein [Thermoanaerobaculia bacterium]
MTVADHALQFLRSRPPARRLCRPLLRGEMTVMFTLRDADRGTEVLAAHENVPPGVAPADNEAGWRMSLEKLARLVEGGQEK